MTTRVDLDSFIINQLANSGFVWNLQRKQKANKQIIAQVLKMATLFN